ncbi:MAG: LysM peptidoglycan-binding domain-containing protein [Actinomycetota bacterium]|nr:LysM peptidoglycan-binding domain-containing protein [Actinomycetota bacterium]
MMASAELSNRPAAGSGKVVPRDARSVQPAAFTRPLPAPPPPVPPIAPPARRQHAACRALAPAVSGAEAARRPTLWPSRVARLVAVATVTLAVAGGLSWIGQDARPGVPAETAVTRVGAGETVWDVARRVAPRSDQRAVVERIQQLNGMVGSAVQPGQQLQVPDGR